MRAYVARAGGRNWITLADINPETPTITITEEEAKKLRNKLQSVLGGIEKDRIAEARRRRG